MRGALREAAIVAWASVVVASCRGGFDAGDADGAETGDGGAGTADDGNGGASGSGGSTGQGGSGTGGGGSADTATADGSSSSNDGGSGDGGSGSCAPGSEGCPCLTGQLCSDPGLLCENGMCAPCPDAKVACEGTCLDVHDDDENCGECGLGCTVVGNVGHCEAGDCGPTWTGCGIPLNSSCADHCATMGQSCTQECGASSIGFSTQENCTNFVGGQLHDTWDCSREITSATALVRCCCTQ